MIRLVSVVAVSAALLLAGQARAWDDSDDDGEKPLSPSCRPLLERIEKDAGDANLLVRQASEAEDYDLGDLVIQIVPTRIMQGSDAERLACWRQNRGRRADATTMDAVFTISRMQLRRIDYRIAQGRRVVFRDLIGAFSVERATGVNGPISAYIRSNRFAAMSQGDADWVTSNLDGFYYDPEYPDELEGGLLRLAALCLAHPKDFAAYARSLEYKDAFLAPHPSRGLAYPEDSDPQYLAYLDAERDRIVRDCPT